MNLIRENIGCAGASCLDVGCSGGYYSFGMKELLGGYVLGIDTEQDLIDGCRKLAEENDVINVQFDKAAIDDYLIHSKDRFDVCLYMSVHHHVIARHGIELASYLLKALSNRVRVMFADMGQKNENCPQHKWWQKLPPCQDQKAWLVDYLNENTVFTKIEVIGSSKIHGIDRYFFRMEQ